MSRSLCVVLLALSGCARHFPMPMTADQLATERGGGALVAYLGQRDASPVVCDLGALGPHLRTADADVRNALMDGLRKDRIAPLLWHDCVENLLGSVDRESAVLLLDAVARQYDKTLSDGELENSLVVERRLLAMHTLLVDRTDGVAPHPEVMAKLLAHLRAAIASPQLGPVGRRFGTDLVVDVELQHGMREGRPVDVPVLDALFERADEGELRRYALRLPDAQLRAEARRREVRLRIQRSHYSEVLQHAAAIEETMMRAGVNPVAVAEHRPLRTWVQAGALVSRGVRVRQDLRRHTATLLGYVDDGRGVSVLPQLSLRGALQVELEGINRPVTLCARPDELDPSPCLRASDVELDSPLVYFDPDGTLRFIEHVTTQQTVALAESDRLVIPVMVGGERLAALELELQFETPEDLVFNADRSGGGGPDVHVRVQALETGRLSYTVGRGDERYRAIVERARSGAFHVVSRGADGSGGSDGSSGTDGTAGSAGNNASCPSSRGTDGARGQDGSAGQDGAAGQDGGRGGNILVEVAAGDNANDLLAILRGTMLSTGGRGGSGGSGGRGGSGGAGGQGGSGTTCTDSKGVTVTLSGGSNGSRGSDGRNGTAGTSGSDGRRGEVTLRMLQ